MEKLVYFDTHIIVLLYAKELSLLPPLSVRRIENSSLLISPAVLLELEYLYEVGKIKIGAEKIFKELEKTIGLRICSQGFLNVIHESVKLSWTRDPFDRLIVAQSSLTKSSLITKDELIQKHYSQSLWD